MTPIGLATIGMSIVVGFIVGYIIFKRFPGLLDRDSKKIKTILNNPHLLVEKLKSHGELYDHGKKLEIKVGTDNETGKEVVVVEEKECPKAKRVQKKIDKKTSPKKGKKKGKKK